MTKRSARRGAGAFSPLGSAVFVKSRFWRYRVSFARAAGAAFFAVRFEARFATDFVAAAFVAATFFADRFVAVRFVALRFVALRFFPVRFVAVFFVAMRGDRANATPSRATPRGN